MTGALVLTIGIPGSGKSTLARRFFQPLQITNLDSIRARLSGDEDDQTATPAAVAIQTMVVAARCERRLITCVDNTNLVEEHRALLLFYAVQFGLPTYALVFDVELDEALRRNRARAEAGGRAVPEPVIKGMHERKLRGIPAEGPVPGFTVTRRIGVTDTQVGNVPREHQHATWVL